MVKPNVVVDYAKGVLEVAVLTQSQEFTLLHFSVGGKNSGNLFKKKALRHNGGLLIGMYVISLIRVPYPFLLFV